MKALSMKYADKLDIRAGTRNPEKVGHFKDLAGVTVVQAEMDTKDKLLETFKGVNVLFIVTPPGVDNQVELVTSRILEHKGNRGHIYSRSWWVSITWS